MDSSISSSLATPLLTEMAMTSFGSARKRYRAALMQYTPMSYSVPPPISRLVRMSLGRTRHRERRVEELRRADAAAAHEIDHLQVDLLEVQPIRDHQLDPLLAARVDHALAFIDRHRHRFLTQHVDAGPRRPNRVLGVHRVGQRDIDRVHLFEAGLVVVV